MNKYLPVVHLTTPELYWRCCAVVSSESGDAVKIVHKKLGWKRIQVHFIFEVMSDIVIVVILSCIIIIVIIIIM